MSEQYHFAVGAKRGGPVTFEVLWQMALKEEIKRTDRVWCKGMQEWQLAGTLAELFADLPPELEAQSDVCEPPPLPAEPNVSMTPETDLWAQPAAEAADSEATEFMRAERYTYIVGWPIAMLFAMSASYFGSLESSSEVASIICLLLAGGAAVLALVNWMKMHYRLWSALPPAFARTSPGKAVGFYFIPLWNVYWCFVTFNGLAAGANKTLAALKDKRRCNEGLAIAFSTVQACALCVGVVVPVVAMLLATAAYVLWILWYSDLAKVFPAIERHAEMRRKASAVSLNPITV